MQSSKNENNGENDGSCTRRPPDPLFSASFISRMTFSWPYALLNAGRYRIIKEIDIPHISSKDSSVQNRDLFERIWNTEVERVRKHNSKALQNNIKNRGKRKKKMIKVNLHRAIFCHFLKKNWITQLLFVTEATFLLFQGVALGFLIEAFNEKDDDNVDNEGVNIIDSGYFWAGTLAISGFILVMAHHHLYFILYRVGNQLKNGTVAAIYSKSLRLHSIGGIDEKSISSGQIVNLATNDAERFILCSMFISYIVWGPFMAVSALIIGLYTLGPAFAIGYLLLFCTVPLQFYIGKRFASLRSKIAKITDSRITLVAQAVSGIRVLKMSGWEQQFRQRISKVRQKEMHQIQAANRFKALNEAMFFFSSTTIAIVIFLLHLALGGKLSPRNVFSTITLTNAVQKYMVKLFPAGIMATSECSVSISRLQSFLELPELSIPITSPCNTMNENSKANKSKLLVSMNKVMCYWGTVTKNEKHHVINDNAGKKAIQDINVDFHMGELYCVIGPVGSGKSALVQAIAGELPPYEGSINRYYSSLAYACQDPWITNGTIKENILMGLQLNSEWYHEVVAACGLTFDFTQFQSGDNTIVGDRGVQCSGGQKARISLARAIYRNASLLILDDPLSAVDSKVGRLIFYSAIQDLCVKRDKCVILVTHQHQFIGNSKCILMNKGKIKCIGLFDECVAKSEGLLMDVIQTKNDTRENDTNKLELDSSKTTTVESEASIEKNKSGEDSKKDHEEMNTTGLLQRSTWIEYSRGMGGTLVAISLLIFCALVQIIMLVTIAMIGEWAEMVPTVQRSSSSIGLIVGMGLVVIVLSISRSLATYFFTVRSSQKLHDRMTWSVLRAKIEFFDTNPLGRILNRFSADVGSNDDLLPVTMSDFLVSFGIVMGAIATALIMLPFTLLAFLPLLRYFFYIRRIFLSTSRELKRIEGLTRSPVQDMLGESLTGIATIRSNFATQFFRAKFESTHNSNIRAFFGFISSVRWLGFKLDFCVFIFLTISCFLSVLFNDQDLMCYKTFAQTGWFNISPAILGLTLTVVLQLTSTFQWTIRQSADVVNQMVCVERVAGFCDIPSEADLYTDEDDKNPKWPDCGEVDTNELIIRYRTSLPPALSGLSFQIKGGQRVGVVGRTGCGKSTLVQALFRILEAEKGSIKIDGVDISSLGLNKLRTEMSVIPQYPVLFNNCSIYDNLDPFGKYDRATVKKALEDVQMWEVIKELPEGLDSIVAEGGSNFSVGQRQLICLARAILRKNKILVLDEPTANVDGKTDRLLQNAVAKSFSGSTIIAVAHRLDTIIGYDIIIVLGEGKLLEIGPPRDLLSIKCGHFTAMVEDTGKESAAMLRERAFC